MSTKLEPKHPCISVTGDTYDRLRAAQPHGCLAPYVEELVQRTLDDPKLSAQVVARCRQERA